MCCHRNACRWRLCAGCGRERRLAPAGELMCRHNRWDPATWQMVPCEGSGQPPKALPADPGEIPAAGAAPGTVPGLAAVGGARG
jgi:hypothetical protein